MTTATVRKLAVNTGLKIHARFLPAVHFNLQPGDNIMECHVRRSLIMTRYLLFVLTSVFYLAGPPYSHASVKGVVVLTMLAATLLAQNLYDNWNSQPISDESVQPSSRVMDANNYSLLKLIMVETIGISLLILPAGGLNSPFAWYAINPIITAAVFLPPAAAWGVLALFMGCAIGATGLYPGIDGTLFTFINNHLSILLVFLLTTSLVQIAASLYRRLNIAYLRLEASHEASERSLAHIASLYQALEAFTSREDGFQLAEVLATYTGKLCDRPAICFLRSDHEDGEPSQKKGQPVLRVSNPDGRPPFIEWEKEVYQTLNVMAPGQGACLVALDDDYQMVAAPISCNGEHFGMLAYIQPSRAVNCLEERKKSLVFLADLGGIILERMKSNNLWGRLLVSEEQNRICNEIHDGVSQYLFSMVCALHSISKETASIQDAEIQKHLQLVENTAKRASRELRSAIYQLSPSKRGESIFIDNLAAYLDDLGRLNNIKVDLQAEGSEDVLSPALRKGLYRIVREACSNAIRHGHCSALIVSLAMAPGSTVLEVEDNGRAFPRAAGSTEISFKPGLGIRNMNQIAACFNGELEIESEPGRGTVVRCTIPKRFEQDATRKEAVI